MKTKEEVEKKHVQIMKGIQDLEEELFNCHGRMPDKWNDEFLVVGGMERALRWVLE